MIQGKVIFKIIFGYKSFHFAFPFIGNLEAICREELDAVIVKGIMGCGNDDTCVGSIGSEVIKATPGVGKGPTIQGVNTMEHNPAIKAFSNM